MIVRINLMIGITNHATNIGGLTEQPIQVGEPRLKVGERSYVVHVMRRRSGIKRYKVVEHEWEIVAGVNLEI